MRVAALYDVHGNLPALEAVLGDVERAGADVMLVGGDVASGPMPDATLDLLLSLGERVRFVRGNAERELVDPAARPAEGVSEARASWASARLSPAHVTFLRDLSERLVLGVDGLGDVLFCHGSPRSDEELITRASSEERLVPMLAGVEQTVVVCGHTHVQFDRVVRGVRIVNAGSVGMPYEGAAGAYWALLGPEIELCRTPYDTEAAAAAIRSSGYPEPADLIDALEGKVSAAEATAFFEQMAAEG